MRKKIIWILIVLALTGVLLYLKSLEEKPFYWPRALGCVLRAGTWKREGFIGRVCDRVPNDAGLKCYSNKDCSTGKCVVSSGWQNFEGVFDESVRGECSRTTRYPCFTGEVIINDSPRKLSFPPICD